MSIACKPTHRLLINDRDESALVGEDIPKDFHKTDSVGGV